MNVYQNVSVNLNVHATFKSKTNVYQNVLVKPIVYQNFLVNLNVCASFKFYGHSLSHVHTQKYKMTRALQKICIRNVLSVAHMFFAMQCQWLDYREFV